MVRIVLTADQTLMSEYRHVPLLPFFSCAPAERVPEPIFNFLAPYVPNDNGIARYAPYGLRKIEAALLKHYNRNEVVVAHPLYIDRFISDDTKIVAVNSMDPLGMGPVSMMFSYGGRLTPYTKKRFYELMSRINSIRRKGYKFKVVVGGSGAWQFNYADNNELEYLGIDHVIIGETEHVIVDLFKEIEENEMPRLMNIRSWPSIEEIPIIVGASTHGLIEVMRGCGRGCSFCEPNLRYGRFMPLDKIDEEIKVNVKMGQSSVWVHSEDIFLYKVESRSTLAPNRDAIIELFDNIMNQPGVTHANPTHGTIAPAVYDPDMIAKLSEVLRAGPDNWIGIQPGLETGSIELARKIMPFKAKPLSVNEWPEIVIKGTEIFNKNYWFPAYTLIMGLPEETEDDIWDTVELIDRMEREIPNKIGREKTHFTVTPLSFVPLGALKSKGFYDIDSMLTEARVNLIYKCWKHTILEIDRSLFKLTKLNPILKLTITTLGMSGSRAILWYIRRWAERRGFKIKS